MIRKVSGGRRMPQGPRPYIPLRASLFTQKGHPAKISEFNWDSKDEILDKSTYDNPNDVLLLCL